MSRGTALGLVVLLVALVVTLLLVARSWESVAPQAIEVARPDGEGVSVRFHEHGEEKAGEALRRGDLPGLRQMQRTTDEHATDVERALAEVE
jgi:hypothetical protein